MENEMHDVCGGFFNASIKLNLSWTSLNQLCPKFLEFW